MRIRAAGVEMPSVVRAAHRPPSFLIFEIERGIAIDRTGKRNRLPHEAVLSEGSNLLHFFRIGAVPSRLAYNATSGRPGVFGPIGLPCSNVIVARFLL